MYLKPILFWVYKYIRKSSSIKRLLGFLKLERSPEEQAGYQVKALKIDEFLIKGRVVWP